MPMRISCGFWRWGQFCSNIIWWYDGNLYTNYFIRNKLTSFIRHFSQKPHAPLSNYRRDTRVLASETALIAMRSFLSLGLFQLPFDNINNMKYEYLIMGWAHFVVCGRTSTLHFCKAENYFGSFLELPIQVRHMGKNSCATRELCSIGNNTSYY